ncbi:hypothetical protein CVU75_01965 [Candidatus Dependentiae bacterium HGW-Dependentiae-1]|nr:MAG: hypothetical protein CVU75_01965 [Candidatus Dependentiae bacterium HGW-Dependentiae-1]
MKLSPKKNESRRATARTKKNSICAQTLAALACLLTTTITTTSYTVTPYISPRSVSENAARELVGWTRAVNLADKETNYGSFSVTPEYTHSFRADHIASQLFGCDLNSCNKINISGSDVANRNTAKDWLADYFYLPRSYKGSFSVRPMVQNFLVDFNFYWGLDTYQPGLFFRIHAPLTGTQWDLNMCMENQDLGLSTSGIIRPLTTAPHGTLTDFTQFSYEKTSPSDIFSYTFQTQIPTPNHIYVFTPLYYNRLCPCKKTLARLADIQADFGWNFLLDNDYHLGLFVRGVAPTGNRPHSVFLFEPIIGNGKHWELGSGLTAHATLWRSSEKNDHSCGVYLDANITHFFDRTQCRTFDLKGKPWSRYNLAFKIIPDSLSREGIQQIIFSPVANLTTHATDVSIAMQTDIAALFNYTNGKLSVDFGYEFWSKSCEKFTCHTDCTPAPASNHASVYGCGSDCTGHCACDFPTFYGELDGATWSLAGAKSFIAGLGGRAASYSNATIHEEGIADPPGALVPPFFDNRKHLSRSDVDTANAHTKGRSNKFFTHLSYTWNEREWMPYLGLGGEIELAGKKCAPCECCANTALSHWGLWFKGGISF